MLNGYFLQLVMANHHGMMMGDLLNIMLQYVVYKTLHDQILSYQSMLDLCAREIPSFTFFSVSQEETVNVCADLEDRFAKSKTVPGTRSSHHFVLISSNKIARKLTSEDREFLQFDFAKSLTEATKVSVAYILTICY